MAGKRSDAYVVVLLTCGTRREATRIARTIVSERLAACVNVLETPVRSIYRWKGKIEQSREFLLLIKTTRRHLAGLQSQVARLHSYDVPEFIALPIVAGSPNYLSWLANSLEPKISNPKGARKADVILSAAKNLS